MVSGVVTFLSALVGAIVGGVAAQKTAEYRQKKTDYREYGKPFAEIEAEAVTDLSQKTTELYRFYLVNVRRAATGQIDEEEYFDNIHLRYEEYEEALSRAMPFLSGLGESKLWDYQTSLASADQYIQTKAEADSEKIESDVEDVDAFIREDGKDGKYEFDIEEMSRQHELVKNGVRGKMNEVLRRFGE